MSDRVTTNAVAVAAEGRGIEVLEAMASEMYLLHYGDVFRYVRARVGSRAEAEDITSDVFCKAVAGLKSYRTLRASAMPWLYTIAAHRVADHYRSARPTSELDQAAHVADSGPNPADVVVSRDLVRQVWDLSKGLPASQRRALWLRYGEELELREIAVQMGRSVEAVKLLVHRAVRGIRAKLPVSVGAAPLVLASPSHSSGIDAPALAA